MALIGKGRPGNNPAPEQQSASDKAVENAKYVAQVYVNRRKVWEYRASSKEEAFRKATAEQQKYEGSNSIIVVRKAA